MRENKNIIMILLVVCAVFLSSVPPAARQERLIPGSCTIFSVSKGGSVFFGNNEDWRNPLTYVWVEPPGEGKYGVLCVGFNDFGPQGGINEKGLAFDGNALPYLPIKTYPERRQPSEAIVNKIIIHRCATVEEAIAMARSYDWGTIYSGKFAGQYLLADATGDACVLGFGADGELGVTRKPKGDGFIVSTNFNRVFPENRYYTYPCNRYETAKRMLEQAVKAGDLTVESLASILDAVHQEGLRAPTLYSNIFDLKNGVAYFYDGHRYDRVARLDVAETIRSKQPPRRIKDLFPPEIPE
jgi:penicillin V acylase-like amidase (Ntn superfamily)